MIFKSEKMFFDQSEQRYTKPLWTFDTELRQVTALDEKTGAEKRYDFYSIFARRHIPYVTENHPERFERLVNDGKIHEYLTDIEERTREAVDRQV